MTTMLPPNVKVHLAMGFIDMRKGIDGLAMLVQGVLHQDPFTGHLFVFRGRNRANLIKIIYHDGNLNSFGTMGGTTPVGGTGGTEFWNLLTYNSQMIASGMYLYHIEAPGIGNKIGKFAVIQ